MNIADMTSRSQSASVVDTTHPLEQMVSSTKFSISCEGLCTLSQIMGLQSKAQVVLKIVSCVKLTGIPQCLSAT